MLGHSGVSIGEQSMRNEVLVNYGGKSVEIDLKPFTRSGRMKAQNQIKDVLEYQAKIHKDGDSSRIMNILTTSEHDEAGYGVYKSGKGAYEYGKLSNKDIKNINKTEGLNISVTGNMGNNVDVAGQAYKKQGQTVEYKFDYPGGSITGNVYEIQKFIAKNPQLIPDTTATKNEMDKTSNKILKEAESLTKKETDILEKKPWEYFSTYYNDKLQPQFISNLKEEGVKVDKRMERLIDNYFDVESEDKKNAR